MNYILHKFIRLLLMLVVISVGIFVLTQQMVDHDSTAYISNQPGARSEFIKYHALDQSVFVQYRKWISNLLRGDLGISLTQGASLSELVRQRLAFTWIVLLSGLFLTWVMTLMLGIYSLTNRRTALRPLGEFVGIMPAAAQGLLFTFFIGISFVRVFGLRRMTSFSGFIDAPWNLDKLLATLRYLWFPVIVLGLSGTVQTIHVWRVKLRDNSSLKEQTLPWPIWKHTVYNILSDVKNILPVLSSGAFFVSVILGLPTLETLTFTALYYQQDVYLARNLLMTLISLNLIVMFLSEVLSKLFASSVGLSRSVKNKSRQRERSLSMDEVAYPEEHIETMLTKLAPASESLRGEMIERITSYVAAAIIADKHFPQKGKLPGLTPPPFSNFGHYVLLDYKLLVSVVWQAVDDIQACIEQIYSGILVTSVIWGIIGALAAFFFFGLIVEQTIWRMVLVLASGVTVYIRTRDADRKWKLERKVASIRAQCVEELITGGYHLKAQSKIAERLSTEPATVGDGALGHEKIPVLTVINDKHPFPGYGRLQAENLFVCRPQKDAPDTQTKLSIAEISQAVFKEIVDNVLKSDVEGISFGDVVVIHGNSLCIDSAWLDDDKRPRLWVGRRSLKHVTSVDERASVRTYFAIQILFPKYMTVATFFVRVFMAGNAVAGQIAVATLGPTVYDIDYFQKQLLRHKSETGKDKGSNLLSGSPLAIQQLRLLRLLTQSHTEFQSKVDVEAIRKLDIFEQEDDEVYREEFHDIVRESVLWPGYLTALPNWRESNSLTFTNDFFGKTEALALIRTLYDQISRTLLDGFESRGFNISDYRDSEGHYAINAEKIDQLVLGERIHITTAETSEAKKDEPSQNT